jgi:starch phosphorylase
MFYQQIREGYQAEIPDFWLRWGHPWEIERFDIHYNVPFYGKVTERLSMFSFRKIIIM